MSIQVVVRRRSLEPERVPLALRLTESGSDLPLAAGCTTTSRALLATIDRGQLSLPDPASIRFGPRRKRDAAIERTPRLHDLHSWLWMEQKRSVLVIVQGMDAAGKDGVIRHLSSQLNPEAFRVFGFRAPTPEEAQRHFLDRVRDCCPKPGTVSLFNRSHYEDVLVARVRQLADPGLIERRYAEINDFERSLESAGTRVVKIFLHISPQEQYRRLLARLDNPAKRWKFSRSDVTERRQWNAYQHAYRMAILRCSQAAPWHVVPADRKWYRDWAVAQILHDVFADLSPTTPSRRLNVDRERRNLLQTAFLASPPNHDQFPSDHLALTHQMSRVAFRQLTTAPARTD